MSPRANARGHICCFHQGWCGHHRISTAPPSYPYHNSLQRCCLRRRRSSPASGTLPPWRRSPPPSWRTSSPAPRQVLAAFSARGRRFWKPPSTSSTPQPYGLSRLDPLLPSMILHCRTPPDMPSRPGPWGGRRAAPGRLHPGAAFFFVVSFLLEVVFQSLGSHA